MIPDDWKRELTSQTAPDRRLNTAIIIPEADVRRPANAKLTPESVMYIRYGDWKSYKQLSRELGVSLRTIYECANYFTWRDLP